MFMSTTERPSRLFLSPFKRVRPAAIAATLLAVSALAGCGGSSHSTTAAAVTTAAASTTATDPIATAPKKQAHPPKHNAAADPTSKPAAARPATPNPTVVDPANTHPTAAGPKPIACLKSSGLNAARTGREPNVWEGTYGVASEKYLPAQVFVDGPYKTRKRAAESAASLAGVEIATSGGVYEVTAPLHIPAPELAMVHAVAQCLGPSGGPGGTGGAYSF